MRKLFSFIMAIITNTPIKSPPVVKQQPVIDFTLDEVDAIIRALSTSHFPTKDIEILYGGIYKLQELRKQLNGGKT